MLLYYFTISIVLFIFAFNKTIVLIIFLKDYGTICCVGIQNKVRVPKSGLDKFKDEYSHEELLGYFEMTHLLMDAFERRETEDAYVYQLKDKLIETELIPFLRDFYPLRYQEKKYYEGALRSVEACQNLSELKERMETTYDDFDDAFQIIEDSSLSFLTSDTFDNRCFSYSFQNVSLSSDGKILMECYGSFLGFVRRSLCEVFKKYKLIGAIRVWIDR